MKYDSDIDKYIYLLSRFLHIAVVLPFLTISFWDVNTELVSILIGRFIQSMNKCTFAQEK